ncbi:MAG: biotin carboxylase N-terminal domain-containing protein [Chloroflexota bacterium]
MPDELTPRQAADRIGATTRSVQRWIVTGRLPARRVGGRWRVAIDAIDALGTSDSAPRAGAPPASTGLGEIHRLFVANRGEIAARISRTCARLGILAIVPQTDGPGGLNLLDVGRVVEAARAAGADAVHPGFGFLAESPAFAEAVDAAGLIWVGPPAAAIRTMGDKGAARRLAISLDVPVIPGYDDNDQDNARLTMEADRIGLPLLVKPAAGGGGKGMHAVRDRARLADALAAARREARAAFGDDRLILERLLEGPRHVEIQILFDAHGNGVHLGERDCSIQRRHQKILEESPSPSLTPAVLDRLGGYALALARAVGYVGAGTCEFLVDDRDRAWFLEMNTRLQVEHPVTEAVTGRDLVADQLRIAAGEALGFDREDVRHTGHAVEVRLYAEDAEAGFLPATGRIAALRWPEGPGIRVDAGVELGTEISSRFDPMLAKIIAHGKDRDEALARLAGALDDTLVLGLTTNLRFLRWLVREPAVLSGQARIDTLERIWPPDGWEDRAAAPDAAWQRAARLLAGTTGRAAATGSAAATPWTGGWRTNAPAAVSVSAVSVSVDDVVRVVRLDPSAAVAREAVPTADEVHVDVGGRSVAFRLASPPDVDRAARSALAHARGGAGGDVVAPMPGSVLAVHVSNGDSVEMGQPIVTIEAMKMEHVVAAPVSGLIGDIAVRATDQVGRGQILALITPS